MPKTLDNFLKPFFYRPTTSNIILFSFSWIYAFVSISLWMKYISLDETDQQKNSWYRKAFFFSGVGFIILFLFWTLKWIHSEFNNQDQINLIQNEFKDISLENFSKKIIDKAQDYVKSRVFST